MTWDKNETAPVCTVSDATVCRPATASAKEIVDRQECLLAEAEGAARAILQFLSYSNRDEKTNEEIKDFVSALASNTTRALRLNEMVHEIAALLGVMNMPGLEDERWITTKT